MAEPDNCPSKKNMAVFDFWDEKKVVLSITFYSACKKSEVVFWWSRLDICKKSFFLFQVACLGDQTSDFCQVFLVGGGVEKLYWKMFFTRRLCFSRIFHASLERHKGKKKKKNDFGGHHNRQVAPKTATYFSEKKSVLFGINFFSCSRKKIII